MDAKKILSSDFLDILFEDRNKEYGAYELRKTYNKRISRALIITASIALLAFLGSLLANTINKGVKETKIREVTVQELKEEEKKPLPPPPPPPPKQEPPKVEMKQFTPPKIVKDEEVQKPPPEQTELKEAKIDVINQEGIKDLNIATPTQIDEGKQVIVEKKEDDENKIFEKVEIEAKFPGGDQGWKRYLERKLSGFNPADNGAPAGTYTVYVQFVVDKAGKISDVKALTNFGYGMEDEAVKVIKSGPDWTPAIQNGRQVKAYRKQPITFVVQEE
ncbi:MAG: energy transducer TonB [Bacteroidetes bacterium]|nr:energy transducer TonB [Bacteroidota bacterium]MBS1632102.1 energy transducer TonB [Bacteroidota bacterium]